ncbi:MAG: AAA family ATPase [Nocardioides sp.]
MPGPALETFPTCSSCGSVLPSAASRFCPECGTPVVPVAEVGPESRRTVTLLFTDVTGSTVLAEQLDPEAYRGVMGRYFAVARDAIEYHGGTVEKFVGDAVLAVFGIPEVHEDDAVRAVRAAHDLNLRLHALSEELESTLGVRLAVRTGVNTGSVVAGSARAGGSFATGDAVNTAARLEQAAPPGEVLIGGETYGLVRDAVEVEAVEPVVAKGKSQPVPAYRLLSVSGDARGHRRRLDGPLLGRDRETRALDDAFERTVEHRRGHLVTVFGAAGLGKTRLVSDFVARTSGRAEVVSGRCVSYGHGITFWPMVQVLRQAVGISGDESEEVMRQALRRAMGTAGDGERIAELLLPLLGPGVPGSSEETSWAVRRMLEQLASRRPLVVTVDDLQWAEPTLLELLAQVHEQVADLPLLLVCQARPELLEDHPTWGRGSLNSTTFGLEPLTRDQVASSVSSLLAGVVGDSVVEAVSAWSGGNPLFVEEITSHLVEAELVVRDTDSSWELLGDASGAAVPPTVAALLSARLERLRAPERHLLGQVSVIGLEFTTDDARVVTPAADDVPGLLAALTRRDLLQRVRDAHGETWSFRHILIRDAAYDSLPKALRAELHERFADSIESSATAGAETPAFVAHHLEQAARLRRELAPHDPSVAALLARAVESLVTASDGARDRDDRHASLQLIERAVSLGPESGALRRTLLVLKLQAHEALGQSHDMGATIALLDDATDENANDLDQALLSCERLRHQLGLSEDIDPEQVEAEAHRLAGLARDTGDNLRLRRALGILQYCRALLGHWQRALEVVDQLAEVGGPAEVRGQLNAEFSARWFGPYSLQDLPQRFGATWAGMGTPLGAAQAAFLEAVAAAAADRADTQELITRAITLRQSATPAGLDASGRASIGGVFMMSGCLADACDWFGQAVASYREDGDLAHGSTYLGFHACLLLELESDPRTALDLVDEAEEWTSPYDALSVALVAAGRAMLATRAGDHEAADSLARRAVETIDRTDQVWQQADVRRWVSEVAHRHGDLGTEQRLLREALERYRVKEMAHHIGLVERRLAALA